MRGVGAREAGAHSWDLGRILHLQVFQRNKREGGPHGYAEGESCDQSRDALPVHLPYLLTSGPGLER